MKQRGDQTEIMLLRPCVIKPAFNYIDILLGRASMPRKSTKSSGLQPPTLLSHTQAHFLSRKPTDEMRAALHDYIYIRITFILNLTVLQFKPRSIFQNTLTRQGENGSETAFSPPL